MGLIRIGGSFTTPLCSPAHGGIRRSADQDQTSRQPTSDGSPDGRLGGRRGAGGGGFVEPEIGFFMITKGCGPKNDLQPFVVIMEYVSRSVRTARSSRSRSGCHRDRGCRRWSWDRERRSWRLTPPPRPRLRGSAGRPPDPAGWWSPGTGRRCRGGLGRVRGEPLVRLVQVDLARAKREGPSPGSEGHGLQAEGALVKADRLVTSATVRTRWPRPVMLTGPLSPVVMFPFSRHGRPDVIRPDGWADDGHACTKSSRPADGRVHFHRPGF